MLHAVWNALAKGARDQLVFLWSSVSLATVVLLPVGLLALPGERVPAAAVPFVVATIAIHAVYFYALGRAYRLQEALVFDASVRENIAYGRPNATEEEIVRAAKAADAHEFIAGLPHGYDTVVGQKGRCLSGGQRQRIAIARAMIRNAPILILDEPTTDLDPESGHRILEPLRRLMSGRTTIIISHNLVTVREATGILVLREGEAIERGTDAELM